MVMATIVVNTLIDGPLANTSGDSKVSLREAITAANENRSVDGSIAGDLLPDRIVFDAALSGTIKLSGGPLVVNGAVEIIGPGADVLQVDGDQRSRVFFIGGSQVELSGMTIANGRAIQATEGSKGGGIYVAPGAFLQLTNAVVRDNAAISGGGIFIDRVNDVRGAASISSSSIVGNFSDAMGGGIANQGELAIVNTTIADNQVLPGRKTGIPSTLVVSAFLLNGLERIESISRTNGSTLTYSSIGATKVALPTSGTATIPTSKLRIDLVNTGLDQSFREDTDIEVVVIDTDTDEEGPVIIDIVLIGNNSLDSDTNTLNYNLGGSAGLDEYTGSLGSSRGFSIRPQFFSLNGSISADSANQSDEQVAEAVLTIGDYANVGGGVYSTGGLLVSHSTISGNKAGNGGGVYMAPSSFSSATIMHTLVAGNFLANGTSDDLGDSIPFESSSSFNLIGIPGGSGLVSGTNGNRIGVDWKSVLENDGSRIVLALNGGVLPTIALRPTGLAVDGGDPFADTQNLLSDQRGGSFKRVIDADLDGQAVIDIGAFEFHPSLSLSSNVSTIGEGGGPAQLTVRRNTPTNQAQIVQLAANRQGLVVMPTQVEIPAGQDSATFQVVAIDNLFPDGDQAFTVRASRFGFLSSEIALSVIDNDPKFPWHNAAMPLDVNADGSISPLDALLIVLELQRRGTNSTLSSTRSAIVAPFFDTNADGVLSPLDALLVISQLQRQGRVQGEGEAYKAEDAKPISADTRDIENAHLINKRRLPWMRLRQN